MTLSAGTKLGPYEILTPLGAGAMGEVFRARDTRLGREAAIKVLPESVAGDSKRLHRFEQEARAASALNHPNIVTIYDVGRTDGVSWIAMELVEGSSLRQVLASGALLTKNSLGIGTQIAEGLARAHASGIVHRDLKPENIMVTSDGLVKILDFGLAKLAPDLPEGSHLATATQQTEAGVVMGTIAYMSPEQATGRAVDHRSDQFALGTILYEMACGRRPFGGRTSVETLSAILKEDPAPLSTVNREVPEPLDWIVRRCLAKEPDERYHSTRDLARDLANLRDRSLGGRAVPAIARRRRLGRPLAAALALAALAGAAALLLRDRWGGSGAVRSLAVLPLKSLSGSAEDEALGLGIADTIIRGFSRTGAVTVRPMSAVRRYAKSDADAVASARELKTDAVLEGSVQRSGAKLRISVHLLRTADGRSMWAESFDVPAAEVFEVQDAVSEAVVSRLRLRLDPAQRDQLKKRYTRNAEAYEAFVRAEALQAHSGPGTGGEENRQAIAFFEKAVALDPSYALARANLALAYLWRDLFFEPGSGDLDRAKRELSEAERLDPQLAETHLVRYQMAWSHHQGFAVEAARRELLEAQKLDPEVGHGDLAILSAHMGLEEPFRREIARALEIDPSSERVRGFSVEGLLLLGRPEEAVAAARRVGIRESTYRIPSALTALGRMDEARRAADELLTEDPGHHYAVTVRELIAAASGERPADEQAIRRAEESGRQKRDYHHTTYNIALLRAVQANAAGAVEWLRRTVATGMPNRTLFLRDPMLARLRSSADFAAFDAELEATRKRSENRSDREGESD